MANYRDPSQARRRCPATVAGRRRLEPRREARLHRRDRAAGFGSRAACGPGGEPMSTATPGHTGPVISGPHHDGPQCPDPGLSVSTPFAGLVAELGELGFEPSLRPVQPGHVVYAATDSPVTVTLLTEPGSSHVQVDSPAASQPWYVAWSDGTPLHVQLIALYAV